MFQLEFDEAALKDLDNLIISLAHYLQDLNHAQEVVEKIIQHCEYIAGLPFKQGKSKDELVVGLRSTAFKGYIIFFSYSEKSLIIKRIIHGSRDVRPKNFEEMK